jgi:hypothetical protein
MSNKKISQLTETTDLVSADEFVVVDGGTTKKITFGNLQKEVVNYLVPENITVSDGNDIDLSTLRDVEDAELIRLTWSGSNGSMFMTLPDCTSTNNTNRVIRFISDGTFSTNTRVQLTPASGQTIDGSVNSYDINKAHEGIQLWSDGVEWFIIQKKA